MVTRRNWWTLLVSLPLLALADAWLEDFNGALDPARWIAVEAGGGFGNNEAA